MPKFIICPEYNTLICKADDSKTKMSFDTLVAKIKKICEEYLEDV